MFVAAVFVIVLFIRVHVFERVRIIALAHQVDDVFHSLRGTRKKRKHERNGNESYQKVHILRVTIM